MHNLFVLERWKSKLMVFFLERFSPKFIKFWLCQNSNVAMVLQFWRAVYFFHVCRSISKPKKTFLSGKDIDARAHSKWSEDHIHGIDSPLSVFQASYKETTFLQPKPEATFSLSEKDGIRKCNCQHGAGAACSLFCHKELAEFNLCPRDLCSTTWIWRPRCMCSTAQHGTSCHSSH